jgi:hypothetical protein
MPRPLPLPGSRRDSSSGPSTRRPRFCVPVKRPDALRGVPTSRFDVSRSIAAIRGPTWSDVRNFLSSTETRAVATSGVVSTDHGREWRRHSSAASSGFPSKNNGLAPPQRLGAPREQNHVIPKLGNLSQCPVATTSRPLTPRFFRGLDGTRTRDLQIGPRAAKDRPLAGPPQYVSAATNRLRRAQGSGDSEPA